MNFFQIILKQMRQRSLSTWLTMLSVLLGVGLAISILILHREGQNLFAQTDFGYDIIIGPPKGSPLQITLNTVYHMDQSPGLIPYSIYEDMTWPQGEKAPAGRQDYRRYAKIAIPFMVGDSYNGRRIVGTSPQMFGFDDNGQRVSGPPFEYRKEKSYQLAAGRVFKPRRFEAVIGSDVADKEHLTLYDDKLSEAENEKRGATFRATHGMPSANQTPDIHKPRWHVVGILKPTHTANDRVLFVPVASLYAIAEHESGMVAQALQRANVDPSKMTPQQFEETLKKLGIDAKQVPESLRKSLGMKTTTTHKPAAVSPGGDLLQDTPTTPAAAPATATAGAGDEDPDVYHLDANGDIVPDLPKEEWMLSAVIVKSRSDFSAQWLMYNFKVIDNRATAVNPASVMRDFFNTFFKGSTLVLLIISILVTVVAAASIMTTIYNAVAARRREIAILRALGATRVRILSLICFEAALVGLLGGLLGLLVGHLACAVGSVYLERTMGEGIHWMFFDRWEALYIVGVVLVAFLAGLVPALKAYTTPVATNLAAA
jgi:putative ABC transport system permease protein